jgi:hypothetical protein
LVVRRFSEQLLDAGPQPSLRSLHGHVSLKNLVPRTACFSRRATQPLRCQTRQLDSLLEVYTPVGQRILHVGREVKYLNILPDEAVY